MSGFASPVVAAIVAAATRHGLDPMLLGALVQQESGGDPHAVRYEAGYVYLWDVATKTPIKWLGQHAVPSIGTCSGGTERISQQISWGLCQVMGATAREQGFGGTFLSALCDPEEGAEYGARYLSKLLKRWKGNLDDALSAYNAGAPTAGNYREYVLPVRQGAERFRRSGL